MKSLKLYYRNLVRYKVFSTITIGSFAISIAIIMLLSGFLASEFSYDKHLQNIDRIYRITSTLNDNQIPEQSRKLLIEQLPDFEAVTNIKIGDEPLVYNNHVYEARVINSDEGLFSVLSLEFIAGKPEGLFNDKHNAVITESLSRKLFGNTDALGKTINISHREDLQVAGIIKDFPKQSSLHGELICSTILKLRVTGSCYNNHCTDFYETLVLLKPGVNCKSLNTKITSIIPKLEGKNNDRTYVLSPVKNIYFNTSFSYDSFEHANVKLLKLLAWLTTILLFLAIFNYVNLSIAQNTNRLKEFGVKQILGNSTLRVYGVFILEALLTTLMSTVIAILITSLVKPVFAGMFGKDFSIFSLFSSPGLILATIAMLIIISLVSAIYPAYLATKVRAKDLVQKRHFIKINKFDVRELLTVSQFAASIAVIIGLIVITKQINYVKTSNLGFNKEQLIRIPFPWQASNKVEVVKSVLKNTPGVKEVCHSHGSPGDIRNTSGDDKGTVSMIASEASFMKTFQISLLEGCNFQENEKRKVCLINKTAMKERGWNTIEGKNLFGFEVVGLIDDFHYQDFYTKIGGLIIDNDLDVSHITVRIMPQNIPQTLKLIEKEYKKILPDYEYSFQFYDDFLNSLYRQEEKRASAIRLIAFIAFFISCIGLIGLVEFRTKAKIKEIGIRRVNGARVTDILAMLNQDFIKWVAIAFIIACPIAWYAMHQWLQNFAYKTELSWWVFAVAGMMAVAVALVTVSWQSWRAATRNPVESLRYE